MARYNSVNTTGSVAGGNTITTPYSGLLTTLTGSGTVTIPNPVYYLGSTQTYYNSTGSAITLSTPGGVFNGPGAGGTASLSLPGGSLVTLVSDGTNYLTQDWVGGAIVANSTLTANSTVNLSPSNANVSIQPTGTGTVAITSSTGNPGSMDNVNIGSGTKATGAFTTLTANSTVTFTANTISTAYNTGGALQVTGGVGIGGALYVNSPSYMSASGGVGTGTTTANSTYPLLIQRFVGSSGNLLLQGDDTLVGSPNVVFSNTRLSTTASIGWNGSSLTVNQPLAIGATTPQAKLHVLGTGTTSTTKRGGSSTTVFIENNTASTDAYFELANVSSNAMGILFSKGSSSGNYGLINYQNSTDVLQLYTASTERMRIDGSGYVGVNTTNTNTATGAYTFNVALRARFNGMMLGNNDGSNASDNRISLDWSSGTNANILAQQNVPLQLGSNNAVQLSMAPNYVQVPTSTYFQLGAEAQAQSRTSDSSGGSGPYEMFRVSSTYLCTNGFFAISATRNSFVHCSTWAWSSSHNGSGQGTITQLSSTTYANITVYLDVDTSGDCIVSADWGSSQNYSLYVQKMTGSTLSFANAGTAWSSPSSGYTRYSRSTISSGFHANNGSFDGSLSKGSGSFKIDHPLPQLTETNFLVHSFIEGPNADLIYRGEVELVNGIATVDIDTHSRMTDGTFVALCRKVQCFTTNETDWTPVRGKVVGNILTIEAQDNTSTATVSWMVIGERKDPHMYETDWTDDNGEVIVEPLKKPIQTEFPPYPEHVNTTGNTDGTI